MQIRQRPVARLGTIAAGMAGLTLALQMATIGRASGEILSYNAVAEASGVRITLTVDNGPGTEIPFDGPGPVANASMDSLGARRSFASFPYPGATAVTIPGVLPGLIPGLPSLPAYPFYVSTDYPLVTEARQESPFPLTAESNADGTKSSGSVGLSNDRAAVGALVAEAAVSQSEGSILAEATSSVAGFSVGPLSIARLIAKATTKLSPDGQLIRHSSMELSGVRVADVAVEVTPAGLAVPGGTVPTSNLQQEQVQNALKHAGITVEYVTATETADGVTSAGLQVRQQANLPNGTDSVTWVFGQASAVVGGRAAPDDGGPGETSGDDEAEHVSSGTATTERGSTADLTATMPPNAGQATIPQAVSWALEPGTDYPAVAFTEHRFPQADALPAETTTFADDSGPVPPGAPSAVASPIDEHSAMVELSGAQAQPADPIGSAPYRLVFGAAIAVVLSTILFATRGVRRSWAAS